MNARYEAYSKAHGKDPNTMLALDRITYPGGIMTGYIIWISIQYRNYLAARFPDRIWKMPIDQADFDMWLEGKAN